MGQEVPSLFDAGKWKGKVMEWAMSDDAVKVPLFRFIDSLPSLKTDARVLELLKEYFSHVEDSPLIIRKGMAAVSGAGLFPSIAGKILRAHVASFGRQFIAGEDPKAALKSLERLRAQRLAFTVDLLGEAVLSEKEAGAYIARYLELLEFLGPEVVRWSPDPLLDYDAKGPIPRLDVSLKVSSFYSQLDPMDWERSIEQAVKGLSPVLERAQRVGASITVDMEHYYVKDLTIAVFKALLDGHPDFRFAGITVQTYLKDCREDLLELIRWARSTGRRILIRLVKGAYWDYENVINRQRGWPIPVFLQKHQTDRNFEDLTLLALENVDQIGPVVASHNVRSISHAIAAAESLNIPRHALEFQVIYGMAEPIRAALQRMGFRVRVYTPVGSLIPGMAYLIRRLLENTSNESFLRKAFFERSVEDKSGTDEAHEDQTEPMASDSFFRNQPPIDFSRAESRKRMKEALQVVRKEFNKKYPLFIGEREVWTDVEKASVNPARPEEVVGTVCYATSREAERAVQEAARAWKAWRKTAPRERAQYLFRCAETMRQRRFELMALQVYEVGKNWKEADGDVAEAIDFLKYYAREMLRLATPTILGDLPGELNQYHYEPRGVGVVISPWNFPMAIPTGMVCAAIVTGNCVIFKPSGLSPVSGWKLFEIFRDAGLPPGVLQFVPGPGSELGEYLVSHPSVDFVAFTGSVEVGLRIVELAGQTRPNQRSVKRVIAELGGKNAIIVDDTADLDEAVKGVVESALGFQGQKCSACSRVIVVGGSFEEFLRRLKEAMESICIGPPEDPGNVMGPVVEADAVTKIRRYIELGKKHGNIFFSQETRTDGYYVGPVIMTDVEPNSPVAQAEIFGPVLAVMRAGDIEEALKIANGTVQALTGGIYSRSPDNIRKAEQEFLVGNLYINRKITGALVGRQPFGGFGMSGVGSKTGGPDYLLQFMNPRSICENTMRRGFAPQQR